MTLLIRQGQILGEVSYEIARLEKLAADLDRLACGIMPTAESLAAAPRLDGYVRATRPVPCLVGHCTDHPRLNGPLITTTDLWVVAPELGWVRTLSRFYRLGNPRSGEGQ
jgi:hypothetical protein